LSEKNIGVHYIGGNHDYWIEGYLTRELGIHFYPDDITFRYEKTRFFCQHGDHIVYNHFTYPLIRRIMRAPLAIAMLKWLPVSWTYALGKKVSHYNRTATRIPRVPEHIVNKMQLFLLDKLEEGYDIAISGHVHEPLCIEKDNKYAVILGDWIHNCSYGIWDGSVFRLVRDTWQHE
jgi:UDP-2,3-diacylglucosamine pyrophosphatase LpxH